MSPTLVAGINTKSPAVSPTQIASINTRSPAALFQQEAAADVHQECVELHNEPSFEYEENEEEADHEEKKGRPGDADVC